MTVYRTKAQEWGSHREWYKVRLLAARGVTDPDELDRYFLLDEEAETLAAVRDLIDKVLRGWDDRAGESREKYLRERG